MKQLDHLFIDYPVSRLATTDVGRFGLKKHYMFGLFEVDITVARQHLRQLRRDGQGISFTAWMIKTIGDCVARNPLVHALQWKKHTLIAFHDVDIAIPVERIVDGKGVPLPLLIKQTNLRTAHDIHHEIQEALQKRVSDEKDFILSEHTFSKASLRAYYSVPQAIRLFIWRRLFSNPFRTRRHSGTVMVTTVNAIGNSPGWILPSRTIHNLAVSLGSISKKPWVVGGELAVRDILNLTVTFNHDVIDGVPARRFVQDLIRHIECPGANN
ncbi:2-oxo acid dehydrogenase subunit E2 [candidate division KSB1 bacterium]|nr:2-oxo acid dehydrogenase subunit E2 [candidate division KSB1 bacterium]